MWGGGGGRVWRTSKYPTDRQTDRGLSLFHLKEGIHVLLGCVCLQDGVGVLAHHVVYCSYNVCHLLWSTRGQRVWKSTRWCTTLEILKASTIQKSYSKLFWFLKGETISFLQCWVTYDYGNRKPLAIARSWLVHYNIKSEFIQVAVWNLIWPLDVSFASPMQTGRRQSRSAMNLNLSWANTYISQSSLVMN